MFGKKKAPATETVNAVCKVCGANCFDQEGLTRHATWAHKESASTAGQQEKAPETSGKK
ncbi:MAG: hypothetical protein HYX84_07235 [Chloroflexi bacterium]|nr:hypothetical protein [Chloroflexota bacterium]